MGNGTPIATVGKAGGVVYWAWCTGHGVLGVQSTATHRNNTNIEELKI